MSSGRSIVQVVPGVGVLRSYRPGWFGKDLTAGLILTALLVPQGMAYAELAGLPPITGLYTSILCLTAYAIFGPSKILVLGPDSSLGPMIAACIIPLVAANGDPAKAVAYGSILALMVGAITVLAGVFKLGFVADLLSKPTQIGYMNGLALTIVIGQLPKLFGFSIDADGLIDEFVGFVNGVADGETVSAALAIGVGSLVLILAFQRLLPRIPGVLVAVVLAILAVNVFDLVDRGVKVVGPLPEGFPPFTIPIVPLGDLLLLFAGALGIALVSLTDTISTASAFAARSGDQIDGDKEMIGIGAANIAAGFFQGFPVSTSGSRTAVAAQNGAKTQVTGLVGAAAIALMLLFAPGLLRNLPQPTLAAVVIAASLSLADIAGMRRLWRQRKSDFALAMTAFLGVALLGVLPGIGLAVALSILDVFRRAWRPYQAVLAPGSGSRRLSRHAGLPARRHAPGPGDLPVRQSAVLRQRQHLPGRDPGTGRRRSRPAVDRGGRRADHRHRHHRRGHARGPRRQAQRQGRQPDLRGNEVTGPKAGRTVRTDRHHQPRAFLPHHFRSGPRLPTPHRRRMEHRAGRAAPARVTPAPGSAYVTLEG